VKKTLLIAILVLCTAQVANSQALLVLLFGDKLSTDKFQLGINASGTLTNLSGIDDTKFRVSWAFGVFGEVWINDTWSFQPELTVKTPAGANDMPWDVVGDPSTDTLLSELQDAELARRANYLTLPLYVKYKAGAFGIGAGPQVGYLTGASSVYTGDNKAGAKLTLEKKTTSELNRWDFGIAAGVDYSFRPEKKMKSLRLGLRGYWGLVDTIKDNPDDAVYNYGFFLTLGIPVGGSPDKGSEEG
jgi:hypothetical protein